MSYIDWVHGSNGKSPRSKSLEKAEDFRQKGQKGRWKKMQRIQISTDQNPEDSYEQKKRAKEQEDTSGDTTISVADQGVKEGAIDVESSSRKASPQLPQGATPMVWKDGSVTYDYKLGTRPLNAAIDFAKNVGTQFVNPENPNTQKLVKGAQITGQALGEAYTDTMWKAKRGLLGPHSFAAVHLMEQTGKLTSERIGKPISGFAQNQLNLDPRLAGTLAFAAEMLAVGGVTKAAQSLKTKLGGTVEGLAYGLGGTGGAGAMRGAGKVVKSMDWEDAYKIIPKGRDKLDDAADYIIPDQIQALNKLRRVVKKQENANLAELRKAGIIKEAPNYKLKSSAEAIEYYGMDTKQLKKYNLKIDQRGKSTDPDFQIGLTLPRAIDTKKREISEKLLTPDKAVYNLGKTKWKRINDKLGQEAHHIIPLHVSTKVMLDFLYDAKGNLRPGGMKAWKARVTEDSKRGIFHGNDRRNIVAARGSTKDPLTEAGQRSEIYHRYGKPDMDNPGYHTLEKLVNLKGLDEAGMPLYHQLRDLMKGQQKLKNQADKFWYEIIEKPRPGAKLTFKDSKLVSKKN